MRCPNCNSIDMYRFRDTQGRLFWKCKSCKIGVCGACGSVMTKRETNSEYDCTNANCTIQSAIFPGPRGHRSILVKESAVIRVESA